MAQNGPFDPGAFDCLAPITSAPTVFDSRGGRGVREGTRWCRVCRRPVVIDSRVGMEHSHFVDQADQA